MGVGYRAPGHAPTTPRELLAELGRISDGLREVRSLAEQAGLIAAGAGGLSLSEIHDGLEPLDFDWAGEHSFTAPVLFDEAAVFSGPSVTFDAGTPVGFADSVTFTGANAIFNTLNVLFGLGTTTQANGILAVASSGSLSCSGTAFFNNVSSFNDVANFNDSIEANGPVILGGVVRNSNKLDYTGGSTLLISVSGRNFIRFDPSGPITVQGFSGGVAGQKVLLYNGSSSAGSNTVTIPFNSVSVAASTRVLNRAGGGVGDYVLLGRQCVEMLYDGDDSLWILQTP